MEQEKLRKDYMQHIEWIESLLHIINDSIVLRQIISKELQAIAKNFATPRLTKICYDNHQIDNESLIPHEQCILTYSTDGYIKIQSLSDYDLQKRGGVGKIASAMKPEDVISKVWICNSHQWLFCLSTHGKLYWLKAYQISKGSRSSKGRPIVNYIPKLARDEKISTILPIDQNNTNNKYFFLATLTGYVKKIFLSKLSKPRSSGLTVVNLSIQDQLIGAVLTNGNNEICLFSRFGKTIRFHENGVRSMGRKTTGVQGMILKNKEDAVIRLLVPDKQGDILTVTENGYGKRTILHAHRLSKRRGKGIVAIDTGKRNGKLISALPVHKEDELLAITSHARLIRLSTKEINKISRTSKGVRLIKLKDAEKLVDVELIQSQVIEEIL